LEDKERPDQTWEKPLHLEEMLGARWRSSTRIHPDSRQDPSISGSIAAEDAEIIDASNRPLAIDCV
jgi:hypothetical protein